MSASPSESKLSVEKAPLAVPSLEKLAEDLKQILSSNFRDVEVGIVDCPDLRSWGLAAPGLCGDCRIVDLGGVPFLFNPAHHDRSWSFKDVADAVGLPGAYLIGAGAACSQLVGTNAELMPCEHVGAAKHATRWAWTQPDGSAKCGLYEHDRIGLLCNMLASKGDPGKVIKIKVAVRTGNTNFVTHMREGLAKLVHAQPNQQLTPHIGLGGVFRLNKGKIKAHVMPDFMCRQMVEADVNDWLKWYEMGPGLICLSVFLSGDPTGGNLNLRLEHTHFFHPETEEGGHFHYTTTPDIVEYEGYFVPAAEVYRVDNAFKANN